MHAWRICRAREVEDLSGQAAAQFGGRWNHPGQAMIYLGLSPAGCALDMFMQQGHVARPGFRLVKLLLPENPTLYCQPAPTELPQGWDTIPADKPSMDFGRAWLKRGEQLGLIIPSVTIAHSHNLLLNPEHPAIHQVCVVDVGDFPCGPLAQGPVV